MEKDVRLEKEREYLDNVKKCILEERIQCVETIKKVPLEYKGRYSQVKWGDEDLVKDLIKIYKRRLEAIDNLECKPYFGSFDFATLGGNPKKYRIGKTDVLDDGNVIVLDWRNPICSLYYDQAKGSVSYESPSGIIQGNLTKKSQQ